MCKPGATVYDELSRPRRAIRLARRLLYLVTMTSAEFAAAYSAGFSRTLRFLQSCGIAEENAEELRARCLGERMGKAAAVAR